MLGVYVRVYLAARVSRRHRMKFDRRFLTLPLHRLGQSLSDEAVTCCRGMLDPRRTRSCLYEPKDTTHVCPGRVGYIMTLFRRVIRSHPPRSFHNNRAPADRLVS
jgi:hypothetical protein